MKATKTYYGHSLRYWSIAVLIAGALGLGIAKAAVVTLRYFYPPVVKAEAVPPGQVLTAVYQTANRHFKGDTSAHLDSVQQHFGKHLANAFNLHEGLLTYTLARETRNGELKRLDVLSEKFMGDDSAMVKVRSTFMNDSTKTFDQPFIRENGKWKFALKYSHHIK